MASILGPQRGALTLVCTDCLVDGEYDRWVATDDADSVDDSRHRCAALLTGDYEVKMNFRVLSRGFDPENLRVWAALWGGPVGDILYRC
jgi:hypothetical protein